MLAARQLAGFSSAMSTFFCTCCYLPIQDIENIDKASWPPRTLDDHQKWVQAWRDAASPEAHQGLFNEHGIHWSELLNLPYWNPILFTVIDSMHTGYLGLFQNHCRHVWGIDADVEGSDGTTIRVKKPIPRPPPNEMAHWLNLIKGGGPFLHKLLSGQKCTKNVLWHICVDHNLRYSGSKRQMADAIVEWVRLLT